MQFNFKASEATLDVIIPCYDAENTLERAIKSCLQQSAVDKIWLIDDASTDATWQILQQWQQRYPDKICIDRLLENGGCAKARNFAAMQSDADFVAFLDADDAYEPEALTAAKISLMQFDYLGLVRLRLKPVGLAQHYLDHPRFEYAWHQHMMTTAGNTIFRRNFFLACGGFPQHKLFCQFGGEDGALGLATVQCTVVGTLFDDDIGVLHHYHEGLHGVRLLDAILFDKQPKQITPMHIAQAEAVTAQIVQRFISLQSAIQTSKKGTMPLQVMS
ncbi:MULTISPECIES: glycosyltransferase family 2 protein [unclassified Acinetobacter]|uniref:glycosyltransferase family 2 protein n=1 Tax=unclassified Acinetobacter TaxID=196816 RepID=UPI0035B9727C